MQEVLHIRPIPAEKTVIDTANALIELGVLKARCKKTKKPAKETDGELSH